MAFLRTDIPGARWVDQENYHITLRFFGTLDYRTADALAYELTKIQAEPFAIRLSGLGSFGGNKPRAIWAGITAGPELKQLAANHERAAQAAGLDPLSRKFSPHLTLARMRRAKPHAVAHFLKTFGDYTSGQIQINQISLLSSRTNSGGGPYVVEQIYPLENNAETTSPGSGLDE